jgi:hypothetical protein
MVPVILSSIHLVMSRARSSLIKLEPPTPMAAFPARLQPSFDGAAIEAEHDLAPTMSEVIVKQGGRLVDIAERKAPTVWRAEHISEGEWRAVGEAIVGPSPCAA